MSEQIRNMIDSIEAGDFVAAQAAFTDAVNVKMSDAIDTRRIEIANSVYNSEVEQEEPIGEEE